MTIKLFKDLKKYTITSTITKEDYDTIKKYRPQALKRQDKDGNDLFALSFVEGRSCVSANGVTFGAVSNDGGYLMITGDLPCVVPEGNYAGYVADVVGAALPYLNEFETVLPDIAKEICGERAGLIESIVEG